MAAKAQERFEFRATRADAMALNEAVILTGKNKSAFIRDAVAKEAARIIDEARRINLNSEEARRFVQALETPGQPNDRLKKAAKRLDESGLA